LFIRREEWIALWARLPRIKSFGIPVAAVTVVLDLWFSKPINFETVFGAFVAALWGYFATVALSYRLSSRRVAEPDALRTATPMARAAS
jgi:hypothetical protein